MYNDAVIMVVCHLFDLQIEKGRIRHERKRRGKQSRVQTGLDCTYFFARFLS